MVIPQQFCGIIFLKKFTNRLQKNDKYYKAVTNIYKVVTVSKIPLTKGKTVIK